MQKWIEEGAEVNREECGGTEQPNQGGGKRKQPRTGMKKTRVKILAFGNFN